MPRSCRHWFPRLDQRCLQVGEFLESFYGSGNHPTSVQAQVRRERIKTGLGETSRRNAIGRAKPRTGESKTVVEMEFWAAFPDNVRVDETRVKDGESESTVEVSRGSERLKRIADGSIEVEREPRRGQRLGDSLPNDFRRHFDRSLIRHLLARSNWSKSARARLLVGTACGFVQCRYLSIRFGRTGSQLTPMNTRSRAIWSSRHCFPLRPGWQVRRLRRMKSSRCPSTARLTRAYSRTAVWSASAGRRAYSPTYHTRSGNREGSFYRLASQDGFRCRSAPLSL
jgi:hypothetical protein